MMQCREPWNGPFDTRSVYAQALFGRWA